MCDIFLYHYVAVNEARCISRAGMGELYSIHPSLHIQVVPSSAEQKQNREKWTVSNGPLGAREREREREREGGGGGGKIAPGNEVEHPGLNSPLCDTVKEKTNLP